MKISSDDVKKVAKLANLPVTQEEEERYSDQLSEILEYIDQLSSADTRNTDPVYDVSSAKNVTREDTVGDSLTQDEALQNAPHSKDGFFVTKGVFDNE